MNLFRKMFRPCMGILAAVCMAVTVVATPANCGYTASQTAQMQSVQASLYAKTEGYGFYLDGEFVAASDSAEDIRIALQSITSVLAEVYGAPEGEHSLQNDVAIIEGVYEGDAFSDEKELLSLLGDKGSSFDFTVKNVYGAPINSSLSLITKQFVSGDTPIAHGEVVQTTDALAVGETVLVKEGTDGVRFERYTNTYINGVLTENVLECSVVTAEPVDSLLWQGTEQGASLMSAEKMMLPYDGIVTSWYGYRTLFGKTDLHNGIDFAGLNGSCYGDDIHAVADGIVTYADWHGNYGLKVVIDHGNGISSLYSHCSKITVSVGDAVLAGETVAKIGNTGRVTGPHLHFGVLVNGVECNPEPYLDWTSYKGIHK